MVKVTLDAEAFKVLASDTRLQILKSLDNRPKTVSELGRELDLNKATVHEHLQQLILGDLVKKKEREGRKWVYYTLSWKGKSLLHPENTTVMVLLSLALLGSGGAVTQLGYWLKWWGNKALSDAAGDGDAGPTSMPFNGPEESERSDDQAGQPAGAESAESAPAEPPAPGDEAAETDSGGDLFEFLTDGDFWIFTVLALMGVALFVAAAVIREKARRRSRKVDMATPGPPAVA